MHPDEVAWITDQVAITDFISDHQNELLAAHQVRAVVSWEDRYRKLGKERGPCSILVVDVEEDE